MFKLIKFIFILLILAVIGAFVYLNMFLKSDAAKYASAMTGTNVGISYVSLSPTTGNIEVGGIDIGNPKGFKSTNAIEFGSIAAEIDAKSIIEDTVIVKNVTIDNPVIYYEVGINGDNLRQLVKNIKRSAGGSGTSANSKEVIIENLYLRNAKVIMAGDFFGYKAGEELEIDDIHLQNIGTGKNGATPEQVTEQVLAKIIDEIVSAKTSKLLGNPGKVLDGLKDLF